MRTLRIFTVVMFAFCSLIIAEAARAQDGYITSGLSYDPQTDVVFAEGYVEFHCGGFYCYQYNFAVDVDLYGPNGFVDSSYGWGGYSAGASLYTYAAESGYGTYTTYATGTILGGFFDYYELTFCGWQSGDSSLSFSGT